MTMRRALIQAEPCAIGSGTIASEDAQCADHLVQLLRLQRVSDAAYARVPTPDAAARLGIGSARREALAARAEALDWKVDDTVRALAFHRAGSWRAIALKLIAWRRHGAWGRPTGFIDADQVLAFSAYCDALRLGEFAMMGRDDDEAVWASIAGVDAS
jgi:hypothetical protein